VTEPAQRARAIADTVLIETGKIEGSLRVINDVGGFAAAKLAAEAALKRVCRASNDNNGWVA
jgi:hypothetical protein